MENLQETKLERAIRALKEADEIIAAVTREAIIEACEPIFIQNPDIQKIGWAQYTPYFNDGEPCVFYSGHDDIGILRTGEVEENEDDESWLYNGEYTKQVAGGLLLASVPEAVMERVFGDHVRVIISRDLTVDVGDFEHE